MDRFVFRIGENRFVLFDGFEASQNTDNTTRDETEKRHNTTDLETKQGVENAVQAKIESTTKNADVIKKSLAEEQSKIAMLHGAVPRELLALQNSLRIPAGQTSVRVSPKQLAALRNAIRAAVHTQDRSVLPEIEVRLFSDRAEKLGINLDALLPIDGPEIVFTEAQLKGLRSLAQAFGELPD